ncbi:MAG: C40 family peptidase [Lachnospiraceae bacterium]|nr:C40 family peptidase [Lachnospiraceae bacterium]
MKHKNAKLAAYALVGVLAVGGVCVNVDATGVSSLLPAAGLALTMEEGSSQEEVASAKDVTPAQAKEKKNNSGKKTESTTAGKSASGTENKEKTEKTARDVNEKSKEKEAPANTETSAKETEKNAAEEEKEKLSQEEKAFSKLVIAKVNDYVNIRSIPSEEGEILGKLYDKSVGDFIEEENGWYKIKSGTVTGYVKGEYCVTGEEAVALAKEVGTRVATVTTTTLKVREAESTDAPVLGLVPIDEELSVVEELDGWVKVDIEEGYGYVSSEFVSLRTDFVKAESREEEEARLQKEEEAKKAAKEAARKAEEKVAKDKAEKAAAQEKEKKKAQEGQEGQQQAEAPAPAPAPAPTSGGSDLGNAVVDYAMQFVGNPYVYGGTSLTNGADCSGFVMSVYKNFGVSLPHSSSADRSQGYDVGGLANAQPGDIVCYSGHVGIYAGNGQIVHASTSKTGIIVSNANYRNVLAVRRIF